MLDQAIAHGGGVVDAAQVRDMLGLADRSKVLDLFEKTLRGDAKAVVAALGEMHDAGADPVVILQDLLELTHWVTRLKVAPEAGASVGRQRARAGIRAGAEAHHGVAHPRLDAVDEGAPGDARRAVARARRRDGADPSVLRRRSRPRPPMRSRRCRTDPALSPLAARRLPRAPRGGGGGATALATQPVTAVAAQPAALPNPRELHRCRGAVRDAGARRGWSTI